MQNRTDQLEAIDARLQYVVARAGRSDASGVYVLPTSGRRIDFAKQKNGWELSRLLWRVGELELTEVYDNFLKTKALLSTEMEVYSFIWSLGRISPGNVESLIEDLAVRFPQVGHIQRVAVQSMLLTNPFEWWEEAVSSLGIYKQLSKSIDEALNTEDEEEIRTAFQNQLTENRVNDWLYYYYLAVVHAENDIALRQLRGELARMPLTGNYFQPIRYILKAAEHFGDDETLVELYYHMYTTEAQVTVQAHVNWERNAAGRWVLGNMQRSPYIPGEPIDWQNRPTVEQESRQRNTKFGFTKATRAYFKKRFGRTLRRSGEAGSDRYVRMATSYLLLADDANSAPAREETIGRYHYDRATRQYHYTSMQLFYPAHHNNPLLHYILHGRMENLSFDFKRENVSGKQVLARGQRMEPHRELWNRNPEATLQLLARSKAELVQEFAQRIFRDQPEFGQYATAEQVGAMLRTVFSKTNEIALRILEDRPELLSQHDELLFALIESPLPAAQQVALSYFEHYRTEVLTRNELLYKLLLHPDPALGQWVVTNLRTSEPEALLNYIFEQLPNLSDGPRAERFAHFLKTLFPQRSYTLSTARLEALTEHPLPEVQQLAVHILKNHETGIARLPYQLLLALLTSEHDPVRGAAVELFGQLPEEQLYAQHRETLLGMCVAPAAEVRDAVSPIVERMSMRYPDFGQEVVQTLSGLLSARGKATEVHDFIGKLLTRPGMATALQSLSTDRAWSLLRSKKFPAQEIGFSLLTKRFEAEDFSTAQLVEFGKHEWTTVRNYAHVALRGQSARSVYEADELLRLIETDWADSRAFVQDFTKNQFKERDWTPERMIALIDSPREDVQEFGVEILSTYFKEENATDYLLKLSQHPGRRVQLLAAEWLERFAAGQDETIEQLLPFFRTLLSQINRGRTAKNLVFDFLEREALRSEPVARMILPLLERLVLTIAVGDRARMILLLNTLRRRCGVESGVLVERMESGRSAGA